MKTLKFLSILLILLMLGSCAAPNYLPFYEPKKHKGIAQSTQRTPRENIDIPLRSLRTSRAIFQPVRQIV